MLHSGQVYYQLDHPSNLRTLFLLLFLEERLEVDNIKFDSLIEGKKVDNC
jgi:hypothetical protein